MTTPNLLDELERIAVVAQRDTPSFRDRSDCLHFLRTHHATLADMAKDAARYRWLRNHRLDFIVRNNSADPRLSLPMGTDLMEPSAADACIDAAIDAAQEG